MIAFRHSATVWKAPKLTPVWPQSPLLNLHCPVLTRVGPGFVGTTLGAVEGTKLGAVEGTTLGASAGAPEGIPVDGDDVGLPDGRAVGVTVGDSDGTRTLQQRNDSMQSEPSQSLWRIPLKA